MRCGNCKQEHDTVTEVRRCHFDNSAPNERKPATEKQRSYAQFLTRTRKPYGAVLDAEETNSPEAAVELVDTLDFDQVRAYIDRMSQQPLRPKGSRPKVHKPVVGEGMYKRDGAVYKVQRAVHGSGHLYVKRFTGSSWVRVPGFLSELEMDDKMTIEDASEFGKLYGSCCVCGRTLTDEFSIAAGIGPICAGKSDWFR